MNIQSRGKRYSKQKRENTSRMNGEIALHVCVNVFYICAYSAHALNEFACLTAFNNSMIFTPIKTTLIHGNNNVSIT